MTEPRQVKLSAAQETMFGLIIGGVIGLGLALANIVSPIAGIGIAAGVGLGSWVNARLRRRGGGT